PNAGGARPASVPRAVPLVAAHDLPGLRPLRKRHRTCRPAPGAPGAAGDAGPLGCPVHVHRAKGRGGDTVKWQLRFEAAPLGKRVDGAAWRRGIAMAAQEALLTKRLRQFDGPLVISASFRLPRPRSAAKTAK